jgi:integrase
MADAERDKGLSATLRAARYRDGLFVAFLALRPLRLDNARLIVLGVHVRQTEDGFRFGFEADELKWKNGPALEFDLPRELVPHFHQYLKVYRLILLHGRATDRLWISTRGDQMSDQAVRQQVNAVTKQRIGIAITPHLFRDCAATSIAMDNPEHADIVSRILGHARLKTAEKHYIHGRSTHASRLHAELLLDLRATARRTRRPRARRPQPWPPDVVRSAGAAVVDRRRARRS